MGPHPLKEALGFRLVEYIPQPSNLRHLLLVHINEVELVKLQLCSLVLTFGRICTTLMAASMLTCGLTTTFGHAGPPPRQLQVQYHRCQALLPKPPGCSDGWMGPKLGGPVDEHPGSPNAVSRSHVLVFFCHKNSLFRHNRFSTLFFSMKVAESGKIVLVSCIIDFKDIQV